jgi:hypothetical protein
MLSTLQQAVLAPLDKVQRAAEHEPMASGQSPAKGAACEGSVPKPPVPRATESSGVANKFTGDVLAILTVLGSG